MTVLQSADTLDNFAAGASVVASSQRAALFPKSYSFPPVPASNTSFLSQNLTTRPTFFGCNTRTTDDAPLLIYIANGGAPLGQTPVTNTTTLQTTYPAAEIQQMVEQTFDIATQGISTIKNGVAVKDKQFSTCLACAVVDRARRRLGIARSGVCKSCLDRYCFS